MLTIEKFVTMSPEQWQMVIEGTRNPKDSWDLIDSYITHIEDPETLETADYEFFLGEKDHKLLTSLAKGGPVHAKYRRMMPVWVTINAPLYWWKEFDTYKVGTVGNSCSTIHKIHSKEFTLDQFSHEHLTSKGIEILEDTINYLNEARAWYLKWDSMSEKDREHFDPQVKEKKDLWWQMIQSLPSTYNQKRTILLGYEVLHNIYFSRDGHKLDEWHTLRDWIETLPNSEIITTPMKPIFKYDKETLIDILKEFIKADVTLSEEECADLFDKLKE